MTTFELRPEVAAFAQLMEQQLRANDHKPGWKRDHWIDLYYRLREEVTELHDALRDADAYDTSDRGARLTREQVFATTGREAADVANFAMMIADVSGALPTSSEAPSQSGRQADAAGSAQEEPNPTPPHAMGEDRQGEGPEPPWPMGAATNCKRAGWSAFFAGQSRNSCPFPLAYRSLQLGYLEGWDAAKDAADGERVASRGIF